MSIFQQELNGEANLLFRAQQIDGRRVVTAEWQGKEHLPIRISTDFIGMGLKFDRRNPPKVLHLPGVPFPLHLIGRDVEYGFNKSFWYARADGDNLVSWLFYRLRGWWQRHTALIKMRIIYTLHIWNLADYPEGSIASWRYIGKRRPK